MSVLLTSAHVVCVVPLVERETSIFSSRRTLCALSRASSERRVFAPRGNPAACRCGASEPPPETRVDEETALVLLARGPAALAASGSDLDGACNALYQ